MNTTGFMFSLVGFISSVNIRPFVIFQIRQIQDKVETVKNCPLFELVNIKPGWTRGCPPDCQKRSLGLVGTSNPNPFLTNGPSDNRAPPGPGPVSVQLACSPHALQVSSGHLVFPTIKNMYARLTLLSVSLTEVLV